MLSSFQGTCKRCLSASFTCRYLLSTGCWRSVFCTAPAETYIKRAEYRSHRFHRLIHYLSLYVFYYCTYTAPTRGRPCGQYSTAEQSVEREVIRDRDCSRRSLVRTCLGVVQLIGCRSCFLLAVFAAANAGCSHPTVTVDEKSSMKHRQLAFLYRASLLRLGSSARAPQV